MKSHLYRMPKDIGRINHAGEPVWGKSGVIIFLVVGLSMLDAVTLYSVFDKLFYQSPAISMVLTFGCALCLNFVPLLLGRYIHLYRYRMKGVRLWMLLAWLGVFLLLFAATFNLRWQTRSMGFDNSSAALVDITGQNETVKEENAGNDKEAVAATLLLGLLPGITSCVNLGLGYLSDDPVKREIEEESGVEQAPWSACCYAGCTRGAHAGLALPA